jgi:hypothetical protein
LLPADWENDKWNGIYEQARYKMGVHMGDIWFLYRGIFTNYSDLFEIYKKTFFRKSILDIFKMSILTSMRKLFMKHF